jgi:hypothetical protein
LFLSGPFYETAPSLRQKADDDRGWSISVIQLTTCKCAYTCTCMFFGYEPPLGRWCGLRTVATASISRLYLARVDMPRRQRTTRRLRMDLFSLLSSPPPILMYPFRFRSLSPSGHLLLLSAFPFLPGTEENKAAAPRNPCVPIVRFNEAHFSTPTNLPE